jgi:hypothetical protein
VGGGRPLFDCFAHSRHSRQVHPPPRPRTRHALHSRGLLFTPPSGGVPQGAARDARVSVDRHAQRVRLPLVGRPRLPVQEPPADRPRRGQGRTRVRADASVDQHQPAADAPALGALAGPTRRLAAGQVRALGAVFTRAGSLQAAVKQAYFPVTWHSYFETYLI